MVMKGSFEERAAHLSYAAPLIAALIASQVGTSPVALGLVALVFAGGVFAAVTGLRGSRREKKERSIAATLGLVANLVGVAVWLLWAGVR